ncbi:MAG: tetratricopeptide repeat protein [Lachnospiraceae bacterium]|nr:tetratricopeptide repeat protein [Lachnospiraceae bacterium]
MKDCFYCGSPVEDTAVRCPYCGAHQKAYRMIIASSNQAYNEGLARAKRHDLSGAMICLSRALRYNKKHTDARNLLGLVYMEFGEPVLALREWVISKNFCPEDNEADRYLDMVQRKSGMFDRIDNATKKFNQAIAYCQDGNYDLARIQLKRVLSANPKMVRAHQLLALLDIREGKYQEANRSLSAAGRIDSNNALTTCYQQEVRAHLAEARKNNKKKKPQQSQVVDFTDGNDTVRMPRQTFIEALDNSKSGLFNILIGAVIGVLVCVFLVVPTMKQRANSDAASALVNANSQAASSQSNANTLKEQVDTLKKKLDKYEGQADVKGSYEQLITAWNCVKEEDNEAASTALSKVNKTLLDTNGKSIYEEVSKSVDAKLMEDKYKEGRQKMDAGDYAGAIDAFKTVIKIDDTYENGDALYRLAESFEKNGDTDKAIKYYSKVAEDYASFYKGRNSAKKVEQLQAASEKTETEQ